MCIHVSFLTLLTLSLINRVVSVFFDYYASFKIEEKYGKNKKTKEVFIKDEVVETVLDLILSFILYIPCLYILNILKDGQTASLLLMHNHYVMFRTVRYWFYPLFNSLRNQLYLSKKFNIHLRN